MISPTDDKVISCGYNGYELCYSDDIPVEEMFGVRKHEGEDEDITNNGTKTKTKTNDIDRDETRSGMDNTAVMNNATDSEDGHETRLTAIDGKFEFFEPTTERIYPMETMPEKFTEFKQWLKDECRTLNKKKEWIKWFMDIPLNPSELDSACSTPVNDLHSVEELKSAVKFSLFDIAGRHADMECSKKDRDDRLDEALHLDFIYRVTKRDVGWYTMAINKSLENDGES